MPFQKVKPEKLSTSVVRQIEALVLRGILRPGDRLPAERVLSEQLGVSRPSLRQAIEELESSQLLETRPGSGVFVADVLGSVFSPPLIRLFATHEEARSDFLSFRRDLEGMAAERAARLASDTDLKIINRIAERMNAASEGNDAQAEADLDADFHLAIIEASHNVIMVHVMRSMIEMLRADVFYNRQIIFEQFTTRQCLLAQHNTINVALQSRNATAAREAVLAHLDYVQTAMRDQKAAEENERIALLRLSRNTT